MFLRKFRDAVALCRENGRWLAVSLLVAGVWAMELFVVQEYTIKTNDLGLRGLAFKCVRAAFDGAFALSLTFLLGRRGLLLCLTLNALFCLGVVTYFNYFQHTLSILTVLNQWREGLDLGPAVLKLVPVWIVVLFLGLGVAVWRLLTARDRLSPPPFFRRRLAAICFAAYFLVLLPFSWWWDNPRKSIFAFDVGRVALIRGYTQSWLVEWWHAGGAVLKQAVALQAGVRDDLSPLEDGFPVGNGLVVVQLETIGYEVIDQRVNGQELTPFLNSLRRQSMFYRIQSPRINGSADADFCVLMGSWPSPHMVNYKIPNYPFENSLPERLRRLGGECSCFLGDKNEVFGRRGPFERMGFQPLYFRDEMLAQFPIKNSSLGVRDEDLFTASMLLLRKSPPTKEHRLFHFIVTLTSHFPWNTLAENENKLFPRPASLQEKYFNSVRYLDDCLRDYVAALPKGITVWIYGDHTVGIGNGFAVDRDERGEYVPTWIYNTGEDLSVRQKTRNQPVALDGSLKLLDVALFVRKQAEAAWSSPPAADKSPPQQ